MIQMIRQIGLRCSWLGLALLLSVTMFGQESADFAHYKQLNDQEDRLVEFKDDDRMLELKIKQLAVINKSRKKHKREPVQLDILASRVANKMCVEAAKERYLSHWNKAGQKPYHRYAEAGGLDHVSENASKIDDPRGFDQTDQVYLDNMARAHADFMAERAPNDGHKQNIIEKVHNFVGIGVYMEGGYFRYYEEFIDRYYTFHKVPAKVKKGEEFTIELEAQQGHYLFQLAAFYEKVVPRKPKFQSYPDYSTKIVKQVYPWELAKMRQGTKYTIALQFDKPGFYYIHLYQHNKELTQPKSIDTKGKLQASGMVIEVIQ